MKYIIILALVVFASVSNSKGVIQQVDQSNLINTAGGFGAENVSDLNPLSQTFTAGRSGLLTEVKLQLVVLGDPSQITSDMTLTLSRVSSLNTPVGVALATATLHLADVPRLDDAGAASSYLMPIFFDTATAVDQGELFSLTLTTGQPWNSPSHCDWIVTQAVNIDRYPGGNGWDDANLAGWNKLDSMEDFGFQTFVAPVPEPSTLGLLAGGAVVFLMSRTRIGSLTSRRKKRPLAP